MRIRSVDEMTIAGEFYLITHDDLTGKARLHEGALEIGLAAAMVAELLYHQVIAIRGAELQLIRPQPPRDPLHQRMYDVLRAESHPMRTWLTFFATRSNDLVRDRLEREGVLARHVQPRRLRSDLVTWLPADRNIGAYSWSRLTVHLRRGEPLIPLDLALAGLVAATGLDRILLDGADAQAHDYLRAVVDGLPAPLHDLVEQTRSAISADVLTRRM